MPSSAFYNTNAMWAVLYCIAMWAVLYCIAQRITIRKRVYMVCLDVIFLFDIFYLWLVGSTYTKEELYKFCGNIFFGFLLDRQMPRRSGLHGNLLWNPQTVCKVATPFLHSPRKGWGLFLPLLTTLAAICLFNYNQPSEGDRTFSPSEPEEF